MSDADHTTVTFTVTQLEPVRGAGRLAALAAVAIEVDGVALQLQGVRVIRQRDRVTTEAPKFRDPNTGQWTPALILPPELGQAIAHEIHRMLRGQLSAPTASRARA